MLFKVRLANYSARLYAHTKAASKKKSYSHTVLLPQTKLPLRLDGNKLVERDKAITNLPAFSELYNWQREVLDGPEFILHDGPPYANGTPHMGHAMNKILKDTIIRSKIIQRKKVHYVPGWDCHGLPIELKVVSSENSSKLTPIQIRHRARNFAKQAIDKQRQTFLSWGVIGDWNNAYLTFSNSYIKNQINKFYELYEKKLVYRDVKPVYWSPSSGTALAEAELEYNERHRSTAVFVKLKLNHIPDGISSNKDVLMYALVWTTTPWTLPSNQAVCFNSLLSYSIVKSPEESELFIVATSLVEKLSKTFNCTLNIINTFSGNLLKDVTYHHPINFNTILPFLPADHANDSKGTGLVHTAPAHGPDDYLVALKNKIPVMSLVNELGCYTSEAGSKLDGLFVLSEGNKRVLDMISEDILHTEDYIHSYPYDWRTKQPVIIRSSKQWFIDTDSIKTKAIELLENVNVIPKMHSEIYKNNLIVQLRKRPYWCISRQRSWGVPIPVFYDATTEQPIITRKVISHLCDLIDTNGVDSWWNSSISDLLPDHIRSDINVSIDTIKKGTDIFDIWFDSGLSWSNVLGADQTADLYLEGVDQFTGWFQSSLMTSVALQNKAPYKSIYVHGFTVDEQGLKMSKSLGNVIDPFDIVQGKKEFKAYGVDTLRWWVVCHANSDAMAHVSTNVLQASADEVQKIRSVLRFAVGALFDYKEKSMEYSSLLMIDKYLLHLLRNFHTQMFESINNYEFNKLSLLTINFLTNPVSSLYYSAIKDRLYCNLANNSDRQAAQYVLFQIFKVVIQTIAPVVPHLAEELYLHLQQKQEGSIFQRKDFGVNDEWFNLKIAELVENVILNIKGDFHKIVGANTSDVHVTIKISEKLNNDLKDIQCDHKQLSDELIDILQASKVTITIDEQLINEDYVIEVKKSDLFMCERCRRVFADVENELCNRCNLIVNGLENKTSVIMYIKSFIV
ncbi:hypothetical protein ILUMI_21555 [Ignelater luminosus]|uniref:isoleucine--tRNA ligase n=1 Tax=Ignelater luminosus TaxID=2038154 RepID=A0A8K0CC79_IGNLU|nr:hypothetical protein ILUMI_21555 [Ignelater luminosus]